MRTTLRGCRHSFALAALVFCAASSAKAQISPAASNAAAINATATAVNTFGSQRPFAAFSASFVALRDSLVSTARSQIGTRYRLGGEKPGTELDCSALVRYVLGALNVSLPRTARQQATAGESVPKELTKLKPGDLLTFGKGKRISHIGIYVGDGRMVHASTAKKQVIEVAFNSRNPLIKQWKGVRRVVGTTKDSLLALAELK